ncbi:MAG: hypothetical protein HY692_03220, partial [Cyanobacteria bacterium NC_groundwater_1444_Ag_S-0.65um_54_12]|nr:hypothetical protein [Cyanobacteria bacterium NC_groundwater_1444_Ag_S-0.65um_54_12]
MMRGYHKSSWNNLPWLSLLASSLALSLVLTGTGCQLWPASSGKGLQPADTGTARRAVPPLEGRIESSATAHQEMIPERSVQAVVGDIANGATVSLIDADTGQTVSTTVSAPDGRFSLQFPASFVPAQNKPYYLEAIKGLAVGGKANRAGASLARLRTLVVNNASWNSLSVTSVSLGRATTAVATIAGLRALDTGAQLLLLGKVSGTSFTAAGTSIDQAEYDRVFALVTAALEGDQDPLEVIAYDASGLAATTKYRSKPGQLVIHDSFAPALAATGDVVTFRGQNFPTSGVATPQIAISGVPLASWSVNASRSALAVTLPDNGYSGYLQITQGASSWFGPFVKVRGTVGT